jgi:hypothetical protein
MLNWNWWTKLKTNKTFRNEPRIKIKNQNNKYWTWNIKNKEDQAVILGVEERKE